MGWEFYYVYIEIISGCKLVHFKLVPSFVESQMESILSSAETISLKLFNIFS